MLKHILAAAPANGEPAGAPRAAALSADGALERKTAPRTAVEGEKPFPKTEAGRPDGLGPRTDAKGDALYRESAYANRDAIETPLAPHSKREPFSHHRYQNAGARAQPQSQPPPPPQPQPQPQPQRAPHHHPLNVSTLDSSKRSLGGTSSGASPGAPAARPPAKFAPLPPSAGRALSALTTAGLVPANVSRFMNRSKEAGIKETLTSLGLLCLVSLLLALLSLIFLLKISPADSAEAREPARADRVAASTVGADEYAIVYEVTLALCALTLSLNLCCLLVCAIQFLFAVKLVDSSAAAAGRTNKYLQKSAITRVCAVGGFFISIPVFLTGIILYTFIQFHSTPAIVTSVFIGLGIIFCGCAMVHNVFVWQKEKTNAVKALHSVSQVADASLMSATQNVGSPPSGTSLTGNGYITANGHVSSPANATGIAFHNTPNGTAYNHHPITILPHQGPYIIRPPTGTPPTPGDVGGTNRPPRPPRPPASGSVSPPGVPSATLDLSHPHPDPHELSTLV